MLIKNLTSKTQKLVVKALGREDDIYDVYICPHGSTETARASIILNAGELSGAVSFEDEPVLVSHKIEVPPVITEDIPEELVSNEELPTNDNTENFICDECGAEFASARGLAAHKSKAHPAK